MTKEEIEAKMIAAGLPRPSVIPHRALDKTFHFDLNCGEPGSRRSKRVPRGPKNDKAVAEAIAQLNG